MKNLSEFAYTVMEGLRTGLAKRERHPCSLCRAMSDVIHFHGSDLTVCPRAVQYKLLLRRSGKSTTEVSHFLADGHIHEAQIVACLRAAGFDIRGRQEEYDTDEKIVKLPNFSLVLHTDGIFVNQNVLLECKAVKEWSFTNRFPPIPENYQLQMQAYMLFHDLAGGVLVVKNRHTSEHKVFPVPRNDDLIKQRLELLESVLVGIENTQWVACQPSTKDEQRYCEACRILGKVI